ncbi:MAG: protein phosphatase 2C domain-containing protein [Desulfopila sp.]|nr:protein phosphatase 2C domain-containing protein [Desulfopila sp.]
MFESPICSGSSSVVISDTPRISTLLEKGSGAANEDELLIGIKTYGVFDGATSLVAESYSNGRSGGKMAADICKAAFSDESRGLQLAAVAANQAIREEYCDAGITLHRKEELWSCSAAVVRLSENSFDWCQIGDCQIVVIREDGSSLVLGRTPDQDVETLQRWKEKTVHSDESVMETMSREILEVRRRTNIDFGVFNGEPAALKFLQNGTVSLSGVKDIVLFSDGLLLPQTDPGALPDWEHFIALYREGGLKEIRNYVRMLQLRDITCRNYPRFKIHDDISGIALSFK